MAIEEILNEGVRIFFGLSFETQAILAGGTVFLGWYLIKRLTTPADRR